MDAKTVKLLEEKVSEELHKYLRENLTTAHQLSEDDWTEIYHNAGMSDKEIEEYHNAHKKMSQEELNALNDQVEEYNS